MNQKYGETLIPLKNTAELSTCREYRYALWRTWDVSKPRVLFIGLNPSTADEKLDDPTLVRCMNFAKYWEYGGVSIGNLFALRSTQPTTMKSSQNPIGPHNDRWLVRLSKESQLTIGAWGNHGSHLSRASQIRKLISNLYYLKLNASGEPAHPLYLRSNLIPKPLKN